MPRAIAVPLLLLAACGFSGGEGQKVTVLLSDRTVTCEAEDGVQVAHLALDQEDDLYLAEFVNPQTGVVRTLEGTRSGLDVAFACPDGVDTFFVRHATVLQARVEDGSTGGTPPAGGNGTPAPTGD